MKTLDWSFNDCQSVGNKSVFTLLIITVIILNNKALIGGNTCRDE